MNSSKRLNIIYDGRCDFCVRVLKIVRALDVRGALRFYDANDSETLKRFPELREADLNNAMYALSEGEPAYRGFYAFRRLIWSSPLMWPLIPLFYFPGATFLGVRIYAWIACNRSRFGCHSEVCFLPPKLG